MPAATSAARFRQRTGIQERTAIYIGRIDENKGCVELFDFWKRYAEITPGGLHARAHRHAGAADSRAPADQAPRLRERRGEVRRAGRGRVPDHAVVFREPVDGGARSVGARQAGARQRQLRRAARPGRAQQRAGSTTRTTASSSRPCASSMARRTWPPRSARTAAASSARTTPGRSSSGSTSTCSSGSRARTPARSRGDRRRSCPGGGRRRQKTLPPAREVARRACPRARCCGRDTRDTANGRATGAIRRRARRPRVARRRDPATAATARDDPAADGRRASGAAQRRPPRPRTRGGRRDATTAASADAMAGSRARAASRRQAGGDAAGAPRPSGRRRSAVGRATAPRGQRAAASAAAAGRAAVRRGRTRRRCAPRSIRCWRRSATATPSATRCSASSGCCAPPATSRRSSSRRPTGASKTSPSTIEICPTASHPDNLLIHHFSIGSRASRVAYALPDRMALVYHNITPPEFFIDVHPLLVQLCYLGRRELGVYANRVELGLGDSEYNRAELEALGFAHTAVLPVVPDFSHLSGPPNFMQAGAFDDDWVNILFVGRMIPNKRIEDVIRAFHAYKRWFNPRSRLLLVGSHGGFERYLAMVHDFIGPHRRRRRAHARPRQQRGAGGLLRDRGRVPVRQRARGLLRAADGGVPHGRARAWRTRPPPCRPRWTAAACCIDRKDPIEIAGILDALVVERGAARSRCSRSRTPHSTGCWRRTSAACSSASSRRRWRGRAGRRRRWPSISGTRCGRPSGWRRSAPAGRRPSRRCPRSRSRVRRRPGAGGGAR